jgi:hypothetical protein
LKVDKIQSKKGVIIVLHNACKTTDGRRKGYVGSLFLYFNETLMGKINHWPKKLLNKLLPPIIR